MATDLIPSKKTHYQRGVVLEKTHQQGGVVLEKAQGAPSRQSEPQYQKWNTNLSTFFDCSTLVIVTKQYTVIFKLTLNV